MRRALTLVVLLATAMACSRGQDAASPVAIDAAICEDVNTSGYPAIVGCHKLTGSSVRPGEPRVCTPIYVNQPAGTACVPVPSSQCVAVGVCAADGTCVPSPANTSVACDDGDSCTSGDHCDGAGACIGQFVPGADDHDACTADVCDGAGVAHVSMLDDANPCTADACDPALGVSHVALPAGTPCPGASCLGPLTCSGPRASGPPLCVCSAPPPPDPAAIAPPLDSTTAATMDDVAGFLLGTIQFGNSASFDPARVAVVRGRVLTASGEALPNVRLGVKDHDEYGYTLSRADGRFDLVVSGGLSLILVMEKPGFVTAHRDVETVAQQFQVVEDVRLAPLDVASTVVQFGAAQPRMHLASTVTDGAGTRRAGIYFPSSLGAAVRDENGTLVQLPRSVTVRATELTVGDKPTLMPARLPASTAYTYAVELTADGVSSTQEISFSKPVYLYVDDLLGFPPGAVIPNGYYNRKTAEWEAVEDGVVIRITGVDPAGQAVLEAPAAMLDPAANDPHYITPEERITLANAYPVGQTLWRAPVRHFSAYDLNNSLGCVNENSATKPCEEPNQDGPVVAETDDKPECEAGSIIECQNQTLSESVPVSGSPYRLVYRSDRVPGRRDLRSIKVSIDPARVPSYALQTNDANCAAQGESKTIVTAVVAGRVLEQAGECVYDASARRYVVTFVWDGRDPYGRPLQGRQAGYVKFEHEYPVINVYTSGGRGSSFSMFATGLNTTFVEGRSRVRRAQRFPITVEYWTPGPTSMGGWEFDARHTYVPGAKMLLYGDGRRSQASLRFGGYSISTIATIPTKSSAATLATAIAPDGTLYAVSPERIYRVDGDGTTTAIAGGGNIDPPWTDAGGVDAASVRFVAMESGGSPLRDILAVPDGSFYFGYANRIHRLWSTDGGRTYRVRTLWGNGNAAMTGDGLYAADPSTGLPNPAVAFSKPSSLALGPDGSLFVLHYNRLRQIDPSGIVRSVNNVSATFNSTAGTVRGSKLLMGPDGSLYFTALCAAKRLRPDPSAAGSKTYPLAPELVAGTGTCPTPSAPYTEGAKATATPVGDIVGLAWLPDGGLLMGDYTQRTLHVRWPDGSVSDVAGNGELGFSGDGGPATSAAMGQIVGAPSVGPDGSIYVPTYWYASPSNVNFRIRRLTPRTPAYDGGDISIADESGSEIFVFDRTGRHLATMNGANGALVRGFCYDTSGRLTRIAECASAAAYSCESGLGWTCSGPTTTIERDSSSGFPSAIISGPAASRNVVGQDSLGQGYLGWIQNQAGERYGFVYDSAPGREGLLTQFIEPRGTGDIRAATHVLQYDDRGRLRVDRSPSGGAKTLARVETPTDTTVTVTTSLAQTTSYRTVQSETTLDGKTVAWTKRGDKKRVTTFPDSTSQTTQLLKNGSTVVVSPDGTVATTSISGDPRFGLQSPVPSVTITTPEGRSYAVKEARTAEPASEPDPLGKTRLTTTTTATWTSGTKQVTSTTSSVWSRASAESLEATATTTSAGGRQVTSQLDGLGRPVTVAAPGRHPIVLSYDDFGRITNVTQSTRHWTIAYDDGSRRATLTGPAAQSATVEFDNAGRPVTVDLPGGRRAGEAWYADGEPRTVSPPGRGAHGFGFDDATGLVSRYTPPSLDDGANWPSVIVSDLDERPRQGLLGVQGTTAYDEWDADYDPATGQLTSVSYMKSASGSTQLATTFGYDPATGLVSSVQAWEQGHSQPQVTTTYGHDGFLPTSEAWSTTDPSWHVAGTVAYDYDVAFTVGSVAVTSGANTSTVSYTRDLDGLITAAGALAITRENATNAPTHNSGRVTGTSLGVVSTTQDDCPGSAQVCTDFGELADFTARSGGTSVYSYSFTRDGLGRITRNVETILGATSTYDYEYEEAGRLAHVRKDGALLRSYGYDLNGNREYENGAPVAWFDAQDRLLSHGQEVFTYGRTGALETRSGPGGVTTYAYDTFGSLRSVALPGGTRVDYLVDGLNRRVGKKVNGVQVEGFLYDGQLRPVAWLDGSGAVYARFVYGLHVSVPEYMVTGAGTFRFLTDHLGSPRLVVNTSTGAVMQRIDYDEWGQVLADSNPGFQPFGFAGGLYDRDTGLVRFGARDYDPSVGRWTAKDPIGFEGGLNFYEYCGGDPVNFVDPEGHSWAGVRRTIGVIWGAPQELIGIIYGGAGWLLGGDATFSNNGILFENNPIQLAFGGENSAITFGHSMCLASRGDFIRPENGYSTAAHEEQHTYQSEVTGPFYLPVAGVSLLVGALVDGDEHGPYSFMETGPQSSPPRPWPWGGK